MSRHDDTEVLKTIGVLAGMGVILIILWSIEPLLGVIAFFIFVGLIIYELSQRKKHEVKAINYPIVPPLADRTPTGEWDKKIRSIRAIYQSISWELEKNQNQPVIKELAEQIREQASDLLRQAEMVSTSQRRLWLNVSQATATDEQVDQLQKQISAENDDRLRETLAATLDSKRTELANVSSMSDNARYLDALMDRAEATLSELRSRIGMTVAATDEYVSKERNNELADTSSQLRSVSEAMRVTLVELQ